MGECGRLIIAPTGDVAGWPVGLLRWWFLFVGAGSTRPDTGSILTKTG